MMRVLAPSRIEARGSNRPVNNGTSTRGAQHTSIN